MSSQRSTLDSRKVKPSCYFKNPKAHYSFVFDSTDNLVKKTSECQEENEFVLPDREKLNVSLTLGNNMVFTVKK